MKYSIDKIIINLLKKKFYNQEKTQNKKLFEQNSDVNK